MYRANPECIKKSDPWFSVHNISRSGCNTQICISYAANVNKFADICPSIIISSKHEPYKWEYMHLQISRAIRPLMLTVHLLLPSFRNPKHLKLCLFFASQWSVLSLFPLCRLGLSHARPRPRVLADPLAWQLRYCALPSRIRPQRMNHQRLPIRSIHRKWLPLQLLCVNSWIVSMSVTLQTMSFISVANSYVFKSVYNLFKTFHVSMLKSCFSTFTSYRLHLCIANISFSSESHLFTFETEWLIATVTGKDDQFGRGGLHHRHRLVRRGRMRLCSRTFRLASWFMLQCWGHHQCA